MRCEGFSWLRLLLAYSTFKARHLCPVAFLASDFKGRLSPSQLNILLAILLEGYSAIKKFSEVGNEACVVANIANS